MNALKKHYKLLIAIALFIPFLAFVDKVFFAYMEPKAAEAAKMTSIVASLLASIS